MKNQNVSRLLGFCQLVERRHSRLSFTQMRVLLLLCTVGEEGITMTNLAKEIGVTPGAVSRQVDVLGNAGRIDEVTGKRYSSKSCGFVRRWMCPQDYKAVRVALSEQGKAYMDSIEEMIWSKESVHATV